MAKLTSQLLLVVKGMAMGAADVVPGVSGGTIAFVTGIYDRLIGALKSISPSLVNTLFRNGVAAAWQQIDGTFLVCVFSGILLSILSFAHLISYLLMAYPEMLWSFFFGLILVCGLHMVRQVSRWHFSTVAVLLAGAVIAYIVGVLSPVSLEAKPLTLFFAGAIAICAMILPGISGSFILLLMGLYGPVMEAVKSLDIVVLSVFAGGCVFGLLTFSHVLSWLLSRHRDLAVSLLTGLMLGALGKVWPWKETLQTHVSSGGDVVPIIQGNLSPFQYEAATGQPSYLVEGIGLMILAVVLVWGLEWLAREKH